MNWSFGAESPLYKKGDRGPDVSLLQQYLTSAGYNTGGIDGIFGANTEAAVRSLQATYGWPVDGIVRQMEFDRISEIGHAGVAPGMVDDGSPVAPAAPFDSKKWLLIGGGVLVAGALLMAMTGSAPRRAMAGRSRR